MCGCLLLVYDRSPCPWSELVGSGGADWGIAVLAAARSKELHCANLGRDRGGISVVVKFVLW